MWFGIMCSVCKKAWQKLVFLTYPGEKYTPAVGVEPTTFGLEVQPASPLRDAGIQHTMLRIKIQYSNEKSKL